MVRQHHNKQNNVKSDDFKRKVVKVGRKVKRANVTKINVESKKLNVPLQTNISKTLAREDENGILDSYFKQLNHYNQSNRVISLKSIGKFILENKTPDSYIGNNNKPIIKIM